MKPHHPLNLLRTKASRRSRIIGSVLSLVGVLALLVVGGALARSNAIVPKVGEYVGTATSAEGKTGPVTARVSKEGGKLVIVPLIGQILTCEDGTATSVNAAYPTVIKGATYSGHLKVSDAKAGPETTRKMTIKFSSPTAFTGTASIESNGLATDVGSGPCKAGPASFKLHLK